MGDETSAIRSRRSRAFDAGKSARRLRSIPSGAQSINLQIRQYGATVLARSRYLCANNAYASNAKEAFVAALTGDGIKPASLITDRDMREAVHAAFLAWTDEVDADWLTDFYGLQAMIAAEMFEAGECFIRVRRRLPEDGLTVPIQLQLIPAEMLPLNDNRETSGGGVSARVEMGIEFDGIGRRRAYHFLKQHPGAGVMAMGGGTDQVRVPAEEVLHLFRPTVVGQIRGVPHTVSAIAKLAMMDQYDDSELERKRVAAMFGGFVTRELPSEDEDRPLDGILTRPEEADEEPREPLEPGLFVDLNPGEDVKFSEPADVGGNYEVFQYRTLSAIAAGFGVPYADMTGDLRQTSYGSMRAGMVAFRRRINAMQHHVMIYQFCRPIWKLWMDEAVITGVIPISARQMLTDGALLRKAKWVTPRWEWIDPLKDIKAEQMAVEAGFKARSDVIESTGYDPEEVDQRIKADQDRADDLDLRFGSAADPGLAPQSFNSGE